MGGPGRATSRVSGWWVEGGFLCLAVEGQGERRWLVGERHEAARTDDVAHTATAWADEAVRIAVGQRKYIRKVLSEAGYLVRPARRLSPTSQSAESNG